MKPTYDLVIRGGTVADGTGAALKEADIAVADGRIAAVGTVAGKGAEEIDARGLLVTPGFVDLHTHYDGQATWDQRLAPSSWHGITTAVMGNCGVGFAPVRERDRERLLELMEGVEDIPGVVLREGLKWRWESFGEYLDVLDGTARDIDICAQLPHGPLRVFVMGERAARLEPATGDDIAQMRHLAADAVRQGALGFSTSRTLNHRSSRGESMPCLRATEEELLGIALGLQDAGAGVLQFISDWTDPEAEFAMVRRLVERSGRRLSFSMGQHHDRPGEWRHLLDMTEQAARDGVYIRAQVAPRSISILMGLESSMCFFNGFPSYDAIEALPLDEKLAVMRTLEFRERLLGEQQAEPDSPVAKRIRSADRMFPLSYPPVYEPIAEDSLAGVAARTGRSVAAVALDHLVTGDGRNLLFAALNNYTSGDLETCRQMIDSPLTLPGLGDGGAHVSFISDASFPTYLLSHWGRDRASGRFPIEYLVKRLTSDCARYIGLADRGELKPGQKADINVIDLTELQAGLPYIANDLPRGGKRLLQKASGYRRTIMGGVTTYLDGEPTGAMPGRLVRGGGRALNPASPPMT